ncbi:hypothetical protein VHUM_03575 [Vanrija humicola]|uniref:Major facilitator superfamily (MFS) profile domain-containing protein n=1 Tax=Vanrija humicola TaxID=5417 RepID=A0A7D8YWY6_VANHU|nr:hypothetical protein VHUM_03575 [Vanrija humicola]
MGVDAPPASSTSHHLAAILAGRDTRFFHGNQLKLTLIICLVLITSMTNGYDGSMMNGLQALSTWRNYFGHPEEKATLFGIFNAIQNMGSLCGLPFAPYVSDRWGRRMGIFVGCCIMLAATAIQTAAQNVDMFIAARGLIGFGLSFATIASPILITELAFPTHRAPFTALYNTQWYLGSIVAAWTTYGTFRMASNWGWRIPSLLQGLPSIIQFFLIWSIPESPRWLIAHGRKDDAVAFKTKYHCNGDSSDPLIAFEVDEIEETIRQEQSAKSASSFRSLFATKPNRRRMRLIIALAVFSQWSGNGLVSFYLTLILNGIGIKEAKYQTLINGILQIYNFATAITGALLIDRAGRRRLFLICTSGMCVAFTCWTIASAVYANSSHTWDPACLAKNGGKTSKCVALDANKRAGHAVIAFIFVMYGFYNLALSPLPNAYTVEIVPYVIRTKSLMVKNLTVSASATFNQYVNPIALAAIQWRYYIVFCVFIAFEVVFIYLFLIETRGQDGPLPLEEIAELFEGPFRFGFQKNPTREGVADEEGGSVDGKDGALVEVSTVKELAK